MIAQWKRILLPIQKKEEMCLIPGSGGSPGVATHPSILEFWKFHGQRTLAGYSSWGCKESDMTD